MLALTKGTTPIFATLVGLAFAILAATLLEGEALAQSTADKLGRLKVRAESSTVPYNRDAQYPYPRDALENGWTLPPTVPEPEECESNQAALIRDGKGERVSTSDCAITGGRWFDPYTGQTLGQSALEVDHFVPLAEAHGSGSSEWPATRRERFANAPEELLTVKGTVNQSKSDSDPAEWKPPRRAYWCTYATKWINIKHEWKLSMDLEEAEALREMLGVGRCPADGGSSPPGASPAPPAQPGPKKPPPPSANGSSVSEQQRSDGRSTPGRLPDTGGPALILLGVLLVGSSLAAGLAVLRRSR